MVVVVMVVVIVVVVVMVVVIVVVVIAVVGVRWLVACLTSHNMLVYLRDGSAQTIVYVATLR